MTGHLTSKIIINEASWYGKKFQGHKMANGTQYDMWKFTGASRELELGSLVRVTNLKNNKSIEVVITDRPAKNNKRLDLSYSAAKILDITGVEKVRIELL